MVRRGITPSTSRQTTGNATFNHSRIASFPSSESISEREIKDNNDKDTSSDKNTEIIEDPPQEHLRVKSVPKRKPKLPGYYNVESIGGHKLPGENEAFIMGDTLNVDSLIINKEALKTQRLFLLCWSDYPDDPNFEPEENLDGCTDILDEYLRKNNLEPRKVEALVGASDTPRANKRNWLTPEIVLETIQKRRKELSTNPSIEVEIFSELRNSDMIYLIKCNFHLFVVLHLIDEETSLISDGDNRYIEDELDEQDIDNILGLQLIPLKFKLQSKVDYCGGSAVIIALEFLKIANNFRTHRIPFPSELTTSSKYAEKIYNQLYKGKESEKLAGRQENITKRPRLKCSKCSKSWRTTSKSVLITHERFCKG